MIGKLLAIGLGGAVGSILRYLVSGWVQEKSGPGFPLGTLTINVIGCFLIGFLYILFAGPLTGRETLRLALIVGVLGGFTTFSSFSLETLNLLSEGQTGRALLNVSASVVAGLMATLIGFKLGQLLYGPLP